MRLPVTMGVVVLFRRSLRRPLLSATVLCIEVAIVLSLVIHVSERGHSPPEGADWPYDSYFRTLHAVGVLLISGHDVPSPRTVPGILCSFLLMADGIVYVALLTAICATSLWESKFRKGLTVGKIKFTKHILICGWVKRSREMLNELFAPDLQEHRPVVIIDPNIEESPMDHPLLKVIRGDPTDRDVLAQANAGEASAAIIMADRDSNDPNTADARSLLVTLAIESFERDIYSCVEVLNPENVKHFRRVHADEPISVSEIGNFLAVHASLNPGVSRLVLEMVRFGEGAELYRQQVPPDFVGREFRELSAVLQADHDMIPVGVETLDRSKVESGERDEPEPLIVRSHLSTYTLKEDDCVFVLSEDQPVGFEDIKRNETG